MSSGNYFSVANNTKKETKFTLTINDKAFFSKDADVIGEIRQNPYFTTKGFAYATWDWLINNSYHWDPYAGQHWINNPSLFTNSLGFGYCDDAAGVFCRLMESAGYDARIWALSGHVVAEVNIDGAWQIYDPDLQTLYFDGNGRVASYDYIVSTSRDVLISNVHTIYDLPSYFDLNFPYSNTVLDLYKTTGNNVIYEQKTTEPVPDNIVFTLPAGARLTVEGADNDLISMYGTQVPNLNKLAVNFGAVSNFSFQLPLIINSIRGTGTATIDGKNYAIGSSELEARLADRSKPIYDFKLSTSGTNNSVEYLLNGERFSLDESIDVKTSAPLNLTLFGEGGTYTLNGGAVGDYLTLRAATPNEAAGSVLDGGNGDDTITFNGSQAYTSDYVSIFGGNGNDLIKIGLWPGQYVGSVKVKAGPGNDTIQVGHIEGSTNGEGYIDAGAGDDIIQFRGDWAASNGIWGNSCFRLLGNAGDDTFILTGTQVNVVGNGTGPLLSGDAGFDTLHWNGRYNLTIGGKQNPDLGLISGYRQELKVVNIEHIDIASTGANGMHFVFTPDDVSKITAGSDFDRTSLGFDLTGVGRSLFIDPGQNSFDMSAWNPLGTSTVRGKDYYLYTSGGDVLGLLV